MPDIRSLYEKEFLGQWDVADEDLIVTIQGVSQEEVTDPTTHKPKKKVCLSFKETDKKMVLNVTNMKTIAVKLNLGYDYTKWTGHVIQLYKEPDVHFGRDKVGGMRIRVRHPEEIFCEECGGKIEPAFGKTALQVATGTKKKYGQVLCAECAIKRKEAAANEG